jgi:hypothetical protein
MRYWMIVFVLTWGGLYPGAAIAQADKHATPQAAFDAANATFQKADWKAHAACYTDEALEANAGALVFIAEFTRAFAKPGLSEKQDKLLKDIDAIFAKHGLTKEVLKAMPDGGKDAATQRQAFRARGKIIKDKPVFLGEMVAAMKSGGDAEQGSLRKMGGTLKDVVIEGDTARGVVEGKGWELPFAFKKVDGGWRIDSSIDFTQQPKN